MGSIHRAFLLLVLACVAGASGAQPKGDPARGAAKAKACAACHGDAGRAPVPGAPWLAAQLEEVTVLQLFLIREGLREIPQMAGLLKDVTDPDFFDLAAHYVRQAPARNDTKPDPALRARGAALSREMGCGSCHMKDYSGQKQVPRLANQREDYLRATMKDYRDNRRTGPDTSMNGLLHRVPDADIEALAHYLAHQ